MDRFLPALLNTINRIKRNEPPAVGPTWAKNVMRAHRANLLRGGLSRRMTEREVFLYLLAEGEVQDARKN